MGVLALIQAALESTLRMTVPLAVPALGEAVSERAGVMNVGMEGYMLIGAVAAYLTSASTGSVWLGMLMGIVVGAVLSLVHAYLSITLKTNQIISGLAIWLFAMGFSSYIFRMSGVTEAISGFSGIHIPWLSDIPGIGPILFSQSVMFYIAMVLVPVFAVILFKTPFGLKVRATGENPLAVDMVGHSVARIRYISTLICGAMSGLGGSYLVLVVLHRFSENITGGRGFIAMCIVIFGSWSPGWMLGGSLLFAAVDAFQIQLQAAKVPVPYPLLLMLPYIVTIIALVGMVALKRSINVPRKLTIPYTKGEE